MTVENHRKVYTVAKLMLKIMGICVFITTQAIEFVKKRNNFANNE